MAKHRRGQPLPATPRQRAAAPTSPAPRREPAAAAAQREPARNGPPIALADPALGWERLDLLILAGLAALALVLYGWRLTEPDSYVFDEVYHAFTAGQLAAGNADAYLWNKQVPPDVPPRVAYEWTHPALSKLIMQASIRLFGDGPAGWRASQVLFGAAGIGIVYLMGRVFFNRTVGVLAAVLLLLDGLWFVQSRIGMNDVFVSVFLLCAYLAFFYYLRSPAAGRSRSLAFTGVALGLALATKWSAAYSLAGIGLVALVHEVRLLRARPGALNWREAVRAILLLAGSLVIIPAALYLAGYIQFFAMGHSLGQWWELQGQMWNYHSNLRAAHGWASRWWEWPLLRVPVWYYVDYSVGPDRVANIFALGNPLIFWAFLPAIAYVFLQWGERGYRHLGLGLVVLGFFGQWLPWFLSPRISFLYHMLPSVPFGCLAIAYGLQRLRAPRITGAALGLALIAFIYFYPLYAGLPISRDYTQQHYWLSRWQPR